MDLKLRSGMISLQLCSVMFYLPYFILFYFILAEILAKNNTLMLLVGSFDL